MDNCLLPLDVPPIELSGINQVYHASPETVPPGISVVVKLYFTIALPSTSTPPEDCGIDCVTIEGTPPEPAFVL